MQPRERTRGIATATVLAALSFVAAVALRGYVPGADPMASQGGVDDPVALTVVAVLLIASVLVMVVAVIARLRHRRAAHTAR